MQIQFSNSWYVAVGILCTFYVFCAVCDLCAGRTTEGWGSNSVGKRREFYRDQQRKSTHHFDSDESKVCWYCVCVCAEVTGDPPPHPPSVPSGAGVTGSRAVMPRRYKGTKDPGLYI